MKEEIRGGQVQMQVDLEGFFFFVGSEGCLMVSIFSVKLEAKSPDESKKGRSEIRGLRIGERIGRQYFADIRQHFHFAFSRMAASSSWGQPSTRTADAYSNAFTGLERYLSIWS